MTKVAIYGKGGIGKSTTASNISLALARKGAIVLQVGCDPKSDSTRSLLGGRPPATVLGYVKGTPPLERRLEDVVMRGSGGIMCVEAGGPEPGIGCAGRGIITTFETLGNLGIDDVGADVTLFDVLGDVVCGGFAVPLRRENADAVFIVTSGEFMSVYAANNIMRGIVNFGTDRGRVAGIILNRRGMEDEDRIVGTLSKCTGVPIVADVPRSELFRTAESQAATVSEMFPDSQEASIYSRIADMVLGIADGSTELYVPHPLDDAQLEALASGRVDIGPGRFAGRRTCSERGYVGVGSCASRGAVFEAGRVCDIPIVVHGPDSCGYVMSHTQDGHYLEALASNRLLRAHMRNNISCTGMTERDCIFGGWEPLRRELLRLASEGRRTVMVVTTCVSGMIGDDVDSVVREVENEVPGMRIIPVRADGNLTGESEEGRLMVIREFMDMIEPHEGPKENRVNIVDDTFMWFDSGDNLLWTERLLRMVGSEPGVRLFDDCSLEELRSSASSILSVLADDTPVNVRMARMLEAKGMDVLPVPLPRGYGETMEWIPICCGRLGTDPGPALARAESEYRDALERLSPRLSGRRVAVVSRSSSNPDWMIECLLDAGADVVCSVSFRVGAGSVGGARSRFADRVECRGDVPVPELETFLLDRSPDIVVGPGNLLSGLEVRCLSPPPETVSHRASVAFLERVADGLVRNPSPGWMSWGEGA